ncbi:deoxyhypusine synthase family protein [Candidatus Bathyarchaeota archaeon]|jgi:deoxyhypusine synthase|nr:deoxyhypusine synthase family protein [Candidatus Bathyarchaeota archaeon]MBT4319876.1 deoxyhypusine synthase family protein [Candidatus Bathyarchaeota archaeon]MBT4423968.1 deoxyhypusine synthase family protein [Candidatus Bathyarchaeota archaeon]MBT5642006.1 deoxyhypusine synthase family protein [Candidatus Bathyarchaeota archaeon]MBT6605673.1 deoxyhypusine synthase family protein [Candidatus Bathyarchaeota archaeon]
MKKVHQVRLRPDMTVGELAEEMRLTGVMQGGRVGRAVDIVAEMFSDPSYTTFITLSGPLVPGGMRVIFRDLIRDGYIDAVMTNGANMIHDLVESMGRTHYQGRVNVDDEKLYKDGYNRAYDIFIENDTFVDIESYMGNLIDDIPEEKRDGITFHEFLYELGLRIEDDESVLKAAADKNIPIFSPGFLDSMLGIPLWMYAKKKKLVFNPIKDFDLLADMVFDAKKSGAIILGGGTPKHHTQYMHTLRDGLDAAIQLSSARVEDGSLSGAPLRESITWGKLREGQLQEKTATIFGEVTSLFPLIIAGALEKIKK